MIPVCETSTCTLQTSEQGVCLKANYCSPHDHTFSVCQRDFRLKTVHNQKMRVTAAGTIRALTPPLPQFAPVRVFLITNKAPPPPPPPLPE